MHQGILNGSSNAILSNKVARTQLRHRNLQHVSQRIHAQAEREDPTTAVPSQSDSNGVGDGVSRGLISSNNGVVLDRKGGSLEDRIASGEFGKSKLTKERALRPVRRALAKDPIGPGVHVRAQVLLQDNITWLTIRPIKVVQNAHIACTGSTMGSFTLHQVLTLYLYRWYSIALQAAKCRYGWPSWADSGSVRQMRACHQQVGTSEK